MLAPCLLALAPELPFVATAAPAGLPFGVRAAAAAPAPLLTSSSLCFSTLRFGCYWCLTFFTALPLSYVPVLRFTRRVGSAWRTVADRWRRCLLLRTPTCCLQTVRAVLYWCSFSCWLRISLIFVPVGTAYARACICAVHLLPSPPTPPATTSYSCWFTRAPTLAGWRCRRRYRTSSGWHNVALRGVWNSNDISKKERQQRLLATAGNNAWRRRRVERRRNGI